MHRLDKETSGALIVALNEESFVFLQNQFKERTVKKEYIALCHGKMIDESEISVPIGRLPWNRMRFGVIPQGRAAHTKFSLATALGDQGLAGVEDGLQQVGAVRHFNGDVGGHDGEGGHGETLVGGKR